MENNDESLVIAIIQHLIELPDESFKKNELTPAQNWYWNWMRLKSTLMGLHWYSLLQLENDPLPELVQQEVIKESERISITNYVTFLQRLWELTHSAESYVRKTYETQAIPYPFEEYGKYSSACLYIQIIQDLINGQFKKTFSSYSLFSLAEIAKLARHVQCPETKPQKLQSVNAIAKRYIPQGNKSWLLQFFYICEQARKTDPIIAMRLEALFHALKIVAKNAEVNATRKRRTKKSIKPCSHVWQNCELLTGEVYGGTYS